MYNFDTCPNRENFGSLKWDRYKDTSILPLWVADMDFQTAPEILKALEDRLKHGVMGYTVPYDSLYESVINYLSQSHNYSIERDWLKFLPGLVPAINLCCHAFSDQGDSIMTASPVYPPFLLAPRYADRELITTPLCQDASGQWTLDFSTMEASIKPNTKVFILCNPHNPVGRVYSRAELEQLADFCERHDLILISDEIHCDLIFDPLFQNKHISAATLNDKLAKRTITLMAPSKTYNTPGLACAFSIIEDPAMRRKFEKTTRGILTEINCFGYAACEAAFRHGEPWRQELLSYLNSNYKLLKSFLEENIPQIGFKPMQATYLAWLNIKDLELQSPAKFFEVQGVGLSDGAAFGDKNYLRLNFASPRKQLTEALDRMHTGLKKEGKI
jgi:cystathionine beta-lyase